MSEINNTLEEIAERIKRAKSAVILTHMRPDGDAIGSALALSRALDVLGIENSVSDESDIPSIIHPIKQRKGEMKNEQE